MLIKEVFIFPSIKIEPFIGHELHFISQFKYRMVLLFKEGIVEKSFIYVLHDSINKNSPLGDKLQ